MKEKIAEKTMMKERPKIAIVDANTLSMVGLKQILQHVMPFIEVSTFNTFSELKEQHPDQFFHYFVTVGIVLENRQFFIEQCRKTIILTTSNDPLTQLAGFHSICISVPEKQLVRTILMLEQHAHGMGQNLPPMPKTQTTKTLSNREIEVLSLIVQGYINKEVADKLNIGITTVITHRKNITEKLGIKSVSALTIYAVTHGYVDINKI